MNCKDKLHESIQKDNLEVCSIVPNEELQSASNAQQSGGSVVDSTLQERDMQAQTMTLLFL
jgi:hypothetical protein